MILLRKGTFPLMFAKESTAEKYPHKAFPSLVFPTAEVYDSGVGFSPFFLYKKEASR